ncbi:PREDICTED: zinc finger BED domain-containing protein RICESLEEPER 3-like [Camelina sativa]|uniref:Zinc finger BED domain-containing protein RICESLEEPER 3-like n=1 Tax=Camelina sativa TaxID=90675 RepID=A0ABM1Q7K0_CAMSA|nr:PREDICTED: zinc finger BED domain-containing protein RICESLEEPER 3-like [Camelina sativa]
MDSSPFPDNIAKEKDDPNLIPESGNKRKDGPADGGGSIQPDQPKRKPSTRSTVWGHFTRFDDNVKRCKCNYCHKSYGCDSKSGTSHLKAHMESCKHFQAWRQKQSQTVINNQGQLQSGKVTEEVFREASNEAIVLSELPLAFIESIGWKHFCNKVNLYKPHSRRTATKDIVRMYVEMKASLKTWIVASKPRVSLTTNIWVAKATCSSYMVITAHFIDVSWRLRKLIIGFKYITDHKGATISRLLLDCLAEWGIEKILTVTVDNATANTSALKKFQEAFSLRNSEAFVLNGECMHMRCCAHILNLIVRDGLHELSENVTAIRNAVQYVRSSTSRCDSFEQKVVSGKMTRGSLPLDIKTRWNSTYLMLSRAIDFRVTFDRMEAEDKMYNDYFNEVDNGEKKIGPPTRADWNVVERLVRFLIIFYNSTLVVSASTSVASYKCYGEIVTIERNLMSLSNSIDSELKSKVDAMFLKFDKY